jgi:hypothetical protein
VRVLVPWAEGVLMARDLYNDGFELAEQLRSRTYVDWAERVEDAIESGSTATEILMALRWHAGEVLAALPDLPEDTRALAAELVSRIGEVLK